MTTDRFEFDLDSEITKLGLRTANPANLANQPESISGFSKISNDASLTPEPQKLSPALIFNFQERAAIREFDGGQERVDAELAVLDEVLPYLKDGGELIITFDAPQRYRWWHGGQSIEETLRELGASEETIRRYVADRSGNRPKQGWVE